MKERGAGGLCLEFRKDGPIRTEYREKTKNKNKTSVFRESRFE